MQIVALQFDTDDNGTNENDVRPDISVGVLPQNGDTECLFLSTLIKPNFLFSGNACRDFSIQSSSVLNYSLGMA